MENRVALVTGATGTIGSAVAFRLAQQGARVWLGYATHREQAENLKKKILANGGSCDLLQLDVRDPDACQREIAAVSRSGGPITICVCCAAMVNEALFTMTSPQSWDDLVSVNLNGFFNTTRPLLRDMMRLRVGSIVALGAMVASRGVEGYTAYNASKAGLTGAVRSLARELGRYSVRVNLVSPGRIESPHLNQQAGQQISKALVESIPLRRLGTPEEVAAVVNFLCGEQSGYITGATFGVTGGLDL